MRGWVGDVTAGEPDRAVGGGEDVGTDIGKSEGTGTLSLRESAKVVGKVEVVTVGAKESRGVEGCSRPGGKDGRGVDARGVGRVTNGGRTGGGCGEVMEEESRDGVGGAREGRVEAIKGRGRTVAEEVGEGAGGGIDGEVVGEGRRGVGPSSRSERVVRSANMLKGKDEDDVAGRVQVLRVCRVGHGGKVWVGEDRHTTIVIVEEGNRRGAPSMGSRTVDRAEVREVVVMVGKIRRS